MAEIKKFYQWIKKSVQQESTEALIMAAHELTRAIGTRSIEAQLTGLSGRMCRGAPDVVQCRAAGCKLQAGMVYSVKLPGTVNRSTCDTYREEKFRRNS